MRRIGHGEIKKSALSPQALAPQGIAEKSAPSGSRAERFGFMFSGMGDADRLEVGPQTLANLRALGAAMKDSDGEETDSGIPAAYTYFGQFLDHDLTLDNSSATIAELDSPTLMPLPNLSALRNGRTAASELDSVYFLGVPREQGNEERVRVGTVSRLPPGAPFGVRPAGKGDANDLPRQARLDDPDEDRAAIIGDPRNDENTIVAQLHTAFLKAHNSLVDGGLNFDNARKEIILRYQSVILDDFLKRVCHPATYERVRSGGPTFWKVERPEDLFMPAEFAFAAYRFGHSMVRTSYDFNLNFNVSGAAGTTPATLALLFTFTALSGNMNPGGGPGTDTLPENWVIEWERILPMGEGGGSQHAHAIDARLTNFLFELRDKLGNKEQGELAPFLATRNLLRGYAVGLPTGQAVARALGVAPLEGAALEKALPTEALKAAARPFLSRSPLWFYVLAEAGSADGGAGRTLGEVGSAIVMETLHNLIKNSEISLLRETNPEKYRTSLADIIHLAGKQDR